MNIVLLSGGSGKRLWPLSNDVRSKQFIEIFKTPDHGYESMVQRVYRQIKQINPDANVTIATSKAQVSALHNQLDSEIGISIEPERKDTFPAIALAMAYLHDVKKVGLDEPVVVCPVDPYVEEDYFQAIQTLSDLVEKDLARIVLMGMEPKGPSEKFGYIIPENKNAISRVKYFKEKPDKETAIEYLEQGALWNGGVFAFKLGYILSIIKEHIGYANYADIYANYGTLEKTSFDYAVLEQEKDISVMRFNGQWKDLGTWNTLTEAMDEQVIGKGIIADGCENVHIINEMNIPILCVGMDNVVVSASPEGILVADKERSTEMKTYVDNISQPIMFAEKSWGKYRVLDVEKDSMTIKVTLKPGQQMNYHSHKYRNEVWIITAGCGKTIVDGMEQEVTVGDVITMEAECRHTIIAKTELKLVEVQLGKEIHVHDKQKFSLE